MAEIKTLINLVELRDLILKFLEFKDFVSEIKQQCSVHLENNRKKKEISPIIFTLKISYKEIHQETLLNFITRETEYFLETVQEIVHFLVKSFFEQQSGNSSLINISSSEIICNFRFFDLPLELYKFSLRVNHINCSLSTFRCIIQRTDPTVKYIRQSSWKCYNCYNSSSVVIRNRTLTHKAPKCQRCLKPCIELSENRVTSDFCTAYVFEADCILNYREYRTITTLELRLFDDLCQELKIGQEYLVIGKYEFIVNFIMSQFDRLSSSQNQNSPENDEKFFDDNSQDFFGTSSAENLSSIQFTFPTVQNTLRDLYFPANSLNSQIQESNQYLSTFSENYNNNFRSQSTQLEQIHNLSDNTQVLFGNNNDSEELFNDSQNSVHKSDEEIELEVNSSISLASNQESVSTFQPLTLNVPNFNNEDLTTLPESITDLYKAITSNYSDFTFTSIIAGQLCSDKFPLTAYSHLKMSLLMSLVTSRENKLHIMGTGQDVASCQMIMSSIGKFAQRFLRVTSNFDEITVNNNNVIEGGGIILATNGIAFLGNWQRIPPKSSLKLLREIETRTILVDKIQGNYPLETTIWAYWNHTSKIKKDLASISQFINVFGILIIIDEVYNEERKEIIDDLLNQVATKPIDRSNDFQIPDNDFQMYINYARSLSVAFDARALIMLKNYFMATKMIRPDALSEKGYEALKIMAESHAKLCFRKIVSRQDVLVAISIAEKFIKEFFEADSYSSPIFSASSASIDCYDKYMNDLYEWYLNFTKDILEKL